MNTGTQTHENGHEGNEHKNKAEDFARVRAGVVDAKLNAVEGRINDLLSRVEDVAGMTAEIGAHVLPSTAEKEAVAQRGAFARGVHWLDSKLMVAAPYLRAGAAVAAAGGAVYGGVKGAQAAYRYATKPKADAKAMPVSEG